MNNRAYIKLSQFKLTVVIVSSLTGMMITKRHYNSSDDLKKAYTVCLWHGVTQIIVS